MNLKWLIFGGTLFVLGTGLLACDYGRMNDQEALQTHEVQLPEMPGQTIPVTGGIQIVKETPPEKMRNPLPRGQEVLDRGKAGYENYCVMCHGLRFDGNGTVGQSFYPLPTNLRSTAVRKQDDGRLFYTITFGLNRHPGLGFMISETDRWALVHYLRSLQ